MGSADLYALAWVRMVELLLLSTTAPLDIQCKSRDNAQCPNNVRNQYSCGRHLGRYKHRLPFHELVGSIKSAILYHSMTTCSGFVKRNDVSRKCLCETGMNRMFTPRGVRPDLLYFAGHQTHLQFGCVLTAQYDNRAQTQHRVHRSKLQAPRLK